MSLGTRYRLVTDRIARAAESCGRDPADVTLVAVSKTVSVDTMRALADLGHRDFGESRWQEAEGKLAAMPNDTVWHFIGHLQSNKAKRIAACFPWIHTLATVSALNEVAKAAAGNQVLIEVNTSKEAQKSGVFLEGVGTFARAVIECPHVRLRGLMTIGPNVEDANAIRDCFRALRKAQDELNLGLDRLSMGMSGDFEMAIREGSTHVRVGSLLFGDRS